MNKHLKTIFQYFIFFGLGAFFVWLSLKTLNKEKIDQIKIAIREARQWMIIPVFFLLFLSHYLRALRWRLLMEPMGYMPLKANAFFAVMIGYLTNQAVPRLGEVLKCTVLARYEKIPADKLFGTIIIERIIDAITLLFVFGITLVIQPNLYSDIINALFNQSKNQDEKKGNGLLYTMIVIGIILIIIALWMIIKKKTFKDLISVFKKVSQRIVLGISSVRKLKKSGLFFLLTFCIWTIYLLGGYMGFLAMQDTQQYGIREAFTVLSAGSIGMVASPGGIGAYALLIQQTMQLYGLNEVISLAFGWILWMAQTAVVLIGGLFSFVAIPYYNKKRKQVEKI